MDSWDRLLIEHGFPLARLYANENFPLPVVVELRRLGHGVLTSVETGQAGQAVLDEQVLACLRDWT